jgi:DNA-binding response OmpR family regulator
MRLTYSGRPVDSEITRPVWGHVSRRVWGEMSEMSVLLIDDDLALSRLVALVLRRSGFNVDVANSGEAGLQLAFANHYDGVVLDLRMPGKDGRAVFREMRSAGVRTPVLILSAYDARRARDELGSESYMDKPFEPENLVEALKNMLQTPNA